MQKTQILALLTIPCRKLNQVINVKGNLIQIPLIQTSTLWAFLSEKYLSLRNIDKKQPFSRIEIHISIYMCNTCIGQKTFPIDKGRYQIPSSYPITAITDATLTVHYMYFWMDQKLCIVTNYTYSSSNSCLDKILCKQ